MTAGQTFRLPDLGEGLTDAEIVTWRVAVGDEVAIDDVVVDVETAKATVEVPCPYAGRVTEVHAAPGQVIDVGAPLLTVSGSATETTPEESGAVLVGYGTGQATMTRRARRGTPPAAPAAAGTTAPRVVSPVVRRLAHERGVDVTTLHGTGPAGVIVRRDVEAAVSTVSVPPTPVDGRRTILRGARRAAADTLSRSRRVIPDATTWVDVDATELVRTRDILRESRQETQPGRSIGLLALLARITVVALARFPELNASVETDGDDLVVVRHDHVGLGFAAQTDHGLVVPVVRHADQLGTIQLAAEIARLAALARAGQARPADLTGGTFTLNNYGVFGVDGSTPIINHPEAALLGVGRIIDKPWVVDGQLTVRKVGQLSLTFDHRVCDGGTAGGFLRYMADRVEQPVGLLADL